MFAQSGDQTLFSLFTNFPKDFQWTLAFVSPIFREFVAWGTLKLAANAAGKDGAKKHTFVLTISHFVGAKYQIKELNLPVFLIVIFRYSSSVGQR